MISKSTLALAIAGIAVVGGMIYLSQPEPNPAAATEESTDLIKVALPASLSQTAEIGKLAYQAKCAACHGENGAGVKQKGPPLIHLIYQTSHHADQAFIMAAQNGVSAHHWPFGDMPPVAGVTLGDLKNIVAYIREVQQANDIH
ncbi:MAG: cytochrome c [Rhodobacteraceae bacterium]|nr:cytochrome c [Paracoccaceae bacterium]